MKDKLLAWIERISGRIHNWAWDKRWKHRDRDEWIGWDDAQRNAPEIARMAADLGVAMLTVHGRTRRQFYEGAADWRAVGEVKRALSSAGHDIPLIVNGDITDAATARRALAESGADGVMVGRAALGRPWLCGEIAETLWPGAGIAPLSAPQQVAEIANLCADMAAFHGEARGVRRARKHVKAALLHWQEAGWLSADEARAHGAALLRAHELDEVLAHLDMLRAIAGQRGQTLVEAAHG
jgi:tRNA-dihydrouridine synthase B